MSIMDGCQLDVYAISPRDGIGLTVSDYDQVPQYVGKQDPVEVGAHISSPVCEIRRELCPRGCYCGSVDQRCCALHLLQPLPDQGSPTGYTEEVRFEGIPHDVNYFPEDVLVWEGGASREDRIFADYHLDRRLLCGQGLGIVVLERAVEVRVRSHLAFQSIEIRDAPTVNAVHELREMGEKIK